MRWQRSVSRAISEVSTLTRMGRGPRAGLRILLYHAVGSRLADDTYGISIEPQRFGEHVRALKEDEHVKVVALEEAVERPGAGTDVAITFDDGYVDVLRTAAPLLCAAGFPFTVFVTTGFMKRSEHPYLTPSQVRELGDIEGVTIGSHTVNHPRLTSCPEKQMVDELRKSREQLEDVTGRAVAMVSYPYGSVDRRVWAAAREAGYSIGTCSRFSINRPDQDRLLLGRVEIVAQDRVRVLRQKVYGGWDWYRWRQGGVRITD